MKQNLSKIYTLVVVVALVLLGGWSAWDIYRLRTSNSDAARINVEQIKSQLENSYNESGSFSDGSFSRMIRQLFKDNPDLELLTVYSQDSEAGIEFHYDRGEDVELLNYSESSPLTMKDLPDYRYNQLLKSKLTSSLSSPSLAGMELDVIYKVVDRVTIYNILIRLLIVVVVLFFTTLFMIFTVSRQSVDHGEPDLDDDSQDFTSDEDDLSLNWDEDEHPGVPDTNDFSLDDEEFGDLDLNESGGDFDDLDLGSDDMSFDDVTDNFSDDDFNLDEPVKTSDESDSDLSNELSLDDQESDMDFGLDEPEDNMDLKLDDSDMDMDLNLEEPEVDFDMDLDSDDNMSLDEPEEDFDLDLTTDDEMALDDPGDDLDFDIDTDIPEEEDLQAMDHEVSPTTDFDDDLDFENIEDTFSDESPSLYSPKSGVGWEDFIEERVNFELERAASNDDDLVLGVIQSDSLNEENYKTFADLLKKEFNYPDMIFEYKENGFALIVPNTDLDDALRILESFTGKERDDYGDINVGISSRNGRLITGGRIFMEAENALHKAVEDDEKNIVGFRSDPDKFREYLSKK
jgi:hypothetical protein